MFDEKPQNFKRIRANAGSIAAFDWRTMPSFNKYTGIVQSAVQLVCFEYTRVTRKRHQSYHRVFQSDKKKPAFRMVTIYAIQLVMRNEFHLDVDDTCVCRLCHQQAHSYHHRVCSELAHLSHSARLRRAYKPSAVVGRWSHVTDLINCRFYFDFVLFLTSFCFCYCIDIWVLYWFQPRRWPSV